MSASLHCMIPRMVVTDVSLFPIPSEKPVSPMPSISGGKREKDTDYFFMAPDRTKISPMTIYQRYRRYLTGAGISHGGKGQGPRLHDLRHTFAVHVLQKWITEGADLTAMMLILSTYMGIWVYAQQLSISGLRPRFIPT